MNQSSHDDPMDEESSFLGLGYYSSGVPVAEVSTPASKEEGVDASSSLRMRRYLQKCLDYHEQQQQQQQSQERMPISGELAIHDVPQFLRASQPQVATNNPQLPPLPGNSQSLPPSAEEAMAKARAIIERFQQQQQQRSMDVDSTSDTSFLLAPSEYKLRRDRQLEIEKERLQRAMLKNLEYVALKEEKRLQTQLAQLQQTRDLEQQLHQQHAAQLLERQQRRLQTNNLVCQAGIGTVRRQATEQTKRRKGHVVATAESSSIAIYLSGMPRDGSITEEVIHQLFSSYGSIRRVHFYRNKQSGELKGDGLVVYNLATSQQGAIQGQELLQTVCSQMNGAELPCGSVLRIEPAADPDRNKTDSYGPSRDDPSKQWENGQIPAYSGDALLSSTEAPVMSKAEPEVSEIVDATEDLDDFFASLE